MTDEITRRVQQEVNSDKLIETARAVCDVHSPTGHETEVARLLQSFMKELGMRTMIQEVEDGRYNVIGNLDGGGNGRSLMFCGHMDTSYPFLLGGTGRAGLLDHPLPSKVEGGWVYGTGIDNMKSAFACYLGAVESLRRAGARLAGDILITGVVGEVETSPVGQYQGISYRGFGHGSRYLIAHGGLADYCIIGEPTDLRVGLGNCGAVWAKITTHGPVMGSYRATWEQNAIRRATRALEALQIWRASYLERNRHPGVELAVAISGIDGGWPWRAARSPGSCSIYVDVRTAPNQSLIPVRNELVNLVRTADLGDKDEAAEIEFYATIPGSEVNPEEDIVLALQRAHKAIHGEDTSYRYSQATNDVTNFRRFGIPAVIYGPGGARMPDHKESLGEYVRIDNLVNCTKVYALAALDICG
jgi:acetylornithine deacetylase/succinyl-diaminopimelate desuccinylase-like protein